VSDLQVLPGGGDHQGARGRVSGGLMHPHPPTLGTALDVDDDSAQSCGYASISLLQTPVASV
jgi:hypothetical protein